jgi:hypothetical protein
MIISRRGLISGIGALIVAPAIVRATSLMPVHAVWPLSDAEICARLSAMLEEHQCEAEEVMRKNHAVTLYGDLDAAALRRMPQLKTWPVVPWSM